MILTTIVFGASHFQVGYLPLLQNSYEEIFLFKIHNYV